MYFRKIGKPLALCALLAFVACVPALYHPAESDRTAQATLAELQQGRSLYVKKCSGCHTLYLPDRYGKTDWVMWVDRMSDKATFDSVERLRMIQYLTRGR